MISTAQTIHANALLIGAQGVLLRGPAGAGKSALTLDLIAEAQGRGMFARLIADDRVRLAERHGRLIARPHPAIAGAIEMRGVGLIRCAHEPAGVIRLVVDLVAEAARLPEPDALATQLCGVTLPLLRETARGAHAARRILSCLHGFMV